ncbi:ABC transporter substrate-binding protein [Halobacteriovorax sp. HLS]|uniref:substrate-binding periplasmic protein n=1 Tax=Halobacteriovorax sp. HLS TaxID=2234000 RepID=UPI000FDC0263|nr:transporter substrate-binding domain-containing protein [Halobacteriovorax sp. HLS]
MRLITFFFFFLISLHSNAVQVRMAFGEKIPPFCFPETDSGIEIEVIRAALAVKGHKLIPIYYPLSRITYAFKQKEVDATMSDLGVDLTHFNGHYAQPAVFYNNVFVSLKKNNFIIKRPEDIKNLTIISFQGAHKRYPHWISQKLDDQLYFEKNDQEVQVKLLFKERYDLALTDISIFKYYKAKLLQKKLITDKEYTIHTFSKVDPLDYRPIFNSPTLRDDFNSGLVEIKKSGLYDSIINKYLK